MARRGTRKKSKGSSLIPIIVIIFVLGAIGSSGDKKEKNKENSAISTREVATSNDKNNPISTAKKETDPIVTEVATNKETETAASTEETFVTMQRGDSGDAVFEIQSKLAELGFLSSSVDGKYGPSTEQAVKDFQTSNQIEASGIIDKATYDAIYSQTHQEEQPQEPASTGTAYILNTNTKKFHRTRCSSVGDIISSNRWDYVGTREEVISMGYEPCKRCNP